VQKVLWALEELKVPYERVEAGMAFGVVNEPFYKKMNPNSRVPTIEDDGFVLWESNAIVRYLAAKHGMGTLCPTDLQQRADSDRWMDWTSNHLNPPITPVFWGLIRSPPEARQAGDRWAENVGQQLQVLEQGLEGKDYVAGRHFTIAMSSSAFIWRWSALPCSTEVPRIEAYERLKQRPAFRSTSPSR
jgi:glutathione S-transferase